MHILLIWKTDKVFALVYVYTVNMMVCVLLVIPNNEMTFSSFQNTFLFFPVGQNDISD